MTIKQRYATGWVSAKELKEAEQAALKQLQIEVEPPKPKHEFDF